MPDVKFSNLYPYTDFHELNLDWVIKEVKYWSTKVGKTIQSIDLTGTAGLVDTYTITYSDGTTSTFDVTNGNGIAYVAKTGTVGLVDTYTITFQDGNTTTFDVTNGAAAVDPTLTLSDYAADAKVTGDRLDEITDSLDLLPALSSITWTDGKYLTGTTGAEVSNASYSYCKINLTPCPKIKITTWAYNPAGICFYDNNGTFISGINGTNASGLDDYVLTVPHNAASVGVSCVTSGKSGFKIVADTNVQIQDLYANKQCVVYYDKVDTTVVPAQGIMGSNGILYNPGGSYTGKHVSAHYSAGDQIVITGYSVNSSYPAMVIKYDDNTIFSNYVNPGSIYTDRRLTLAKSGTVYINGNELCDPIIKIRSVVSVEEYDRIITDEVNTRKNQLKARILYDGTLQIKKRVSDLSSICISFGHVGGNSLFGFSTLKTVAEASGAPMNDSFTGSDSVNLSDTDWFAPYIVQAKYNADGDVPLGNSYFTGGNHRSNNTAVGGGVTAVESSYAINFNGHTPLPNVIYITDKITVRWTNLIQGNNTSKSDGSGRAILQETWIMTITGNGIYVENDIVPLEDIIIKTYYGIQTYLPGASVIYVGGATRSAVAINSASNSGNTTCREANASTAAYNIAMKIFPVDLGIFSTSYGMFTTSASKLYGNLIATDVDANTGEHFFIKGKYSFWK